MWGGNNSRERIFIYIVCVNCEHRNKQYTSALMLLDNIAPYSYFGIQPNFRGEHSSNSLAVWVVQAYYVFKHTFWSAKYAPVTLTD